MRTIEIARAHWRHSTGKSCASWLIAAQVASRSGRALGTQQMVLLHQAQQPSGFYCMTVLFSPSSALLSGGTAADPRRREEV